MPGAGHGRDTLTLSTSQRLSCVSLSSRDDHSPKFKGQLTGVTPKGQHVELKNEGESATCLFKVQKASHRFSCKKETLQPEQTRDSAEVSAG